MIATLKTQVVPHATCSPAVGTRSPMAPGTPKYAPSPIGVGAGVVDANAYLEEQMALQTSGFASKVAELTERFKAEKQHLMEQLRSAHNQIQAPPTLIAG